MSSSSSLVTTAVNNSSTKMDIPPGTRDLHPYQMEMRETILNKIKRIYRLHGCEQIDTPTIENKSNLDGKYGDNNKLVFQLQELDTGEELSLRYDLTVPFARYIIMNNLDNLKRFHLAKVFRKENAALDRGRFREFYQFDCDMAGDKDLMMPDTESLYTLCQALDEIKIGSFKVRINHKKLSEEIAIECGLNKTQIRAVCNLIDNLDKTGLDAMIIKLKTVLNLSPTTIDKICQHMILNGPPRQTLEVIKKTFDKNIKIVTCCEEMLLLFNYLDTLGILDKFLLDLSIVRGVDYYTGIIFEAFVEYDSSDVKLPTSKWKYPAAIAGGGRYDKLVNMFQTDHKTIPAVGFAIGIERIFQIIESKQDIKAQYSKAQILIAPYKDTCKNNQEFLMKVCRIMWTSSFSTEFIQKSIIDEKEIIKYANDNKIKIILFVDSFKNTIVIKNGEQEPVVVTPEKLIESINLLVNPRISWNNSSDDFYSHID